MDACQPERKLPVKELLDQKSLPDPQPAADFNKLRGMSLHALFKALPFLLSSYDPILHNDPAAQLNFLQISLKNIDLEEVQNSEPMKMK